MPSLGHEHLAVHLHCTRDAVLKKRKRIADYFVLSLLHNEKFNITTFISRASSISKLEEEMVSDSDLVTRLREVLQDSDLDTATAGSIRRKLEEEFGVNLSDRKAFIREQIDIYLETLENNDKEEEEEENAEENNNDVVEGEGEEEDGEEEEEEEEEEEAERKESNERQKKVKKRGGFTKLCSLSPQLQKIVGVTELARTEVVKKLWAYIRENNLQDPKNKRNIKCDQAFRDLFRVNSINMFQMNKALSKHIWPLTAEAEEEEEEEDQSEEEEEEEEEDMEKKKKKGRSIKGDKDGKKRGGGFTKLCSLSPQLQEFIGESELARTEVVKRLWAYIRERNLQDPKNKQNIICDESLHALFHVNSINMFQMNKALSKHIWPLNEEVPNNTSEKEKRSKQPREGSDEPKQKEKRQKKGASGLLAPLPLSDALVKFFGTGENELSRADVVKRMWGYIKQNDLQDPSDKRRIICDDKLKELFEVDSFNGFSVSKLLTSHFIKMEQ
ncbi:DNA ligase 1 isoform X2 [Jatropha curcas]|uniref:DNA ligase 1 isoform X2 n=1 Tax=Jatropha curcas TaxID=180498 RepID=UPI001893FFD4|nr:DNA ligase 1 isoform X2 [Jatropha curcas]